MNNETDEPECARFGLYEGHDHETDEQVTARHKRVRELGEGEDQELQTYVLYEGGWSGGLGFTPTPIPFSNLWMIEGAKLVWACRARNWNDACKLYHRFMGWGDYIPMNED